MNYAPSTYSEIHGNTLRKNTSRSIDQYETKLNTGNLKHAQNQSVLNHIQIHRKRGGKSDKLQSEYEVSSPQNLSITNPKSGPSIRNKKTSTNSSYELKTDSDFRVSFFEPKVLLSDYTTSKSNRNFESNSNEFRNNIKRNERDISRSYYGPSKRVLITKSDLRPSPYHTDTIEEKKKAAQDNKDNFNSRSKSKSRIGWIGKPSALKDNIMDLYDNTISYSDYMINQSTPSSSAITTPITTATTTSASRGEHEVDKLKLKNDPTYNGNDFNLCLGDIMYDNYSSRDKYNKNNVYLSNNDMINENRINDELNRQIEKELKTKKEKEKLHENEKMVENEIRKEKEEIKTNVLGIEIEGGNKYQSLYNTILNLADNNSYRANYDKLRRQNSDLVSCPVNMDTDKNENKNENKYKYETNNCLVKNLRSRSVDSINPGRFYKNVPKDFTSQKIFNILNTNQDFGKDRNKNNLSKSNKIIINNKGESDNKNETEKDVRFENENGDESKKIKMKMEIKTKVKKIEDNIFDHLSGNGSSSSSNSHLGSSSSSHPGSSSSSHPGSSSSSHPGSSSSSHPGSSSSSHPGSSSSSRSRSASSSWSRSGEIGNLRHTLKQLDISHSGFVNFTEFRTALIRKNIPICNKDVEILFQSNAVDEKGKRCIHDYEIINNNDSRYSNRGLSLDIDKFSEYMEQRAMEHSLERRKNEYSSESKKAYVADEYSSTNKTLIQNSGEHSVVHQRAMKKVLLASRKHSDPMTVFRDMLSAEETKAGPGIGIRADLGKCSERGTRTGTGTGTGTRIFTETGDERQHLTGKTLLHLLIFLCFPLLQLLHALYYSLCHSHSLFSHSISPSLSIYLFLSLCFSFTRNLSLPQNHTHSFCHPYSNPLSLTHLHIHSLISNSLSISFKPPPSLLSLFYSHSLTVRHFLSLPHTYSLSSSLSHSFLSLSHLLTHILSPSLSLNHALYFTHNHIISPLYFPSPSVIVSLIFTLSHPLLVSHLLS